MESKTRVAGILIKDGKLLMVKGRKCPELWTPGGTLESGETDEQCLRRELKEEISVELKDMKFFKEYTGKSFYVPNKVVTQHIYIISVKGAPKPDSEIDELIWLSREEFKIKKYPMIPITEEEIIPDLIKKRIF